MNYICNYMLVYKIWIQFTNLFKSYGTKTIFQHWKWAITPKIIIGIYPRPTFYDYIPVYKIGIQYTHLFKRYRTENIFQLFFNIEKGPIFYNYMLVYKIWIQYTNLFKSYGTETIFQSWKRAITPQIIGGFYSKSNLTPKVFSFFTVLTLKIRSKSPKSNLLLYPHLISTER